MNKRDLRREKRKTRVRKKLSAVGDRFRLHVFCSNRHAYAQVIDDIKGITVVGGDEGKLGKMKAGTNKTERARQLGLYIAGEAKKKKVKKVYFDRGRYAFHGRVKAVAEGAKEGGLEF